MTSVPSLVKFGKRRGRTTFSRKDVVEPFPLDRFLRAGTVGPRCEMAYTIGHGASFILCTAGSIPLAGSAGLSADLGHFTVAGPRLCNLEMDDG